MGPKRAARMSAVVPSPVPRTTATTRSSIPASRVITAGVVVDTPRSPPPSSDENDEGDGDDGDDDGEISDEEGSHHNSGGNNGDDDGGDDHDDDDDDDGGGDNDDEEESSFDHDELGTCPGGHCAGRDCQCTCLFCPRQVPGEPISEQIRATIETHIKAGDFVQHETGRVIHGPAPLPIHNLDIELPDGYRSFRQLVTGGFLPGGRDISRDAIREITQAAAENTDDAEELPSQEMKETVARLGLSMMQRPCTEQIPWQANINHWNEACPNDFRGWVGRYRGTSWPCNEEGCGEGEMSDPLEHHLYNGDVILVDEEEPDLVGTPYDESGEDPPGISKILPNDTFPDGNRWVCESHRRDAILYWDEQSLLASHLAPTCKQCRTAYHAANPTGLNTCTCRELLRRWQCRRCYEKKIRHLQRDFRQRITQNYTGDLPDALLPVDPQQGPGLYDYHREWKRVRQSVIQHSPCTNPGLSRRCGGRRWAGNKDVFHCRCCGGVVVLRTATRATRTLRDLPHQQLKFGGTGRGSRTGRARPV